MIIRLLKSLHLRNFLPFLVLALAWQLLITLVASVISHSFTPATVAVKSQYLFDYMLHWDGQWYLSILNGSYEDPNSFSPAFFPLFPLLLWLLRIVTFELIDITALVLILNIALLAASLYFLSRISVYFFPNVSRWILPIIFLLSPVAVFQNFFYTEALFCALTFSAYYYALKQKWSVMALLLVLVTATRLPGILVVGLCGLEYLRFHNWSIKNSLLDKRIFWFAVTPVGIILYSLYLEVIRHDFLAMFHSQSLWSYHRFNLNIFETYYLTLRGIFHNLIGVNETGYVLIISHILPLASLIILFTASLYLIIKKISIPLGVYGLVATVFFSLNSNVVSVHRYMLAMLTIHVALLYLYSLPGLYTRVAFFACMYVSIVVQSILLLMFSINYFAG